MGGGVCRRGGASRPTAWLLAVAVLATGCGARLEPEEHRAAVAALVATSVTAVPVEDEPGAEGVAAGTGQPAGVGVPGEAGGVGDVAVVGVAGSAAGDPAGSGPGRGTPGADTAAGGTGAGSAPTAADTRAAPPGGNGGATDIGVFEDRIVLGNAVDNSGAVPGIFLDAQLATRALVAWFTATEGTIHGRRLVLDARDSRLDAGANREIYLDFCESAFAAIGSMSAFDEGVAGPAEQCGIPDIRSAVVNPRSMVVRNIFSSDALSHTHYPTNHYLYWKGAYPGAEKKAAILYVDNDTTHKQTRMMRGVAQKVGYEYVVDRAIGLAETNYSSYVIELKQKGARFVEFQGDAPQAVRLAKAMRQQGYWPDVFALQQNLYKPALLQQGGVDIEGAEIALGSVMNENIQHHPELQTYRTWLKQVDPQAEPTGQGAYAWGAGLLFIKLAKEIGPDLTREKLVRALEGVHDFDGNGLYSPQDVGGKVPSNCHIMAKVAGGRFVPTSPADGRTFECRGRAEAAA